LRATFFDFFLIFFLVAIGGVYHRAGIWSAGRQGPREGTMFRLLPGIFNIVPLRWVSDEFASARMAHLSGEWFFSKLRLGWHGNRFFWGLG
jgi:hypothetical protein